MSNNLKVKKYGTQLNKSVIEGMETLQALANSEEPIGTRELARELELDSSRVNRLLRTLTYMGLARQTEDRKYTTGAAMQVLAAQSLFASSSVSDSIHSLEDLKHFGLIIAMGVLWKDKVTYLYHALPNMDSIDALGRLGHYPATISSIGLSLLSTHDDEEIRHIYEDREIPGFEHGIDQLINKLDEIRTLGYCKIATHLDEGKSDSISVSVNVGNDAYRAIALSGWIPDSSLGEVVSTLKATASKIAANTK